MTKLVYGVGVYDREGLYKRLDGNGAITKAYKTWQHMLERCYSSKVSATDKRRYQDRGVVVCDHWKVFDGYAEWFYGETSNYQVGYHLDKDIFADLNPLTYSPESCVFVPPELNTFFTAAFNIRGDLPVGVYYRKDTGKYKAQCHHLAENGKRQQKTLGSFDTPDEAFLVYSEFKREMLIQLITSLLSENKIPRRVYDKLMYWTPTPYPN